MPVGKRGEFLNVKHREGRVCKCFAKNSLRIWLKSFFKFRDGSVSIYENTFDSKFFQGDSKQVDGAAVDCGCGDKAVASIAEI